MRSPLALESCSERSSGGSLRRVVVGEVAVAEPERGRSRGLGAADARVHAQAVGPQREDHAAIARAPLQPGLPIAGNEGAQPLERLDPRPLIAAGHARARLTTRRGAPGRIEGPLLPNLPPAEDAAPVDLALPRDIGLALGNGRAEPR